MALALFKNQFNGTTVFGSLLLKVIVHDACKFEHAHAVGPKQGAQLVVGQDGAFVFGVLQVVGLDVVPQFFHHLTPAEGAFVLGE